MEIIQERLEREYGLNLITTAPNVVHRVATTTGEILEIENPSKIPPAVKVEYIEEPYVKATIMAPKVYVGAVMELCQERRSVFSNMEYIGLHRVFDLRYASQRDYI